MSRHGKPRWVCALLAPLLAGLALAGCGSEGGEGEGQTATKNDAGYVDWPFFGRVPERTHYLPAEEGALEPPLQQAWSVNTHALIEFPPAVHEGVAYVINKYGNGKAVRLSDRKVLWELKVRPSDKGKPNFVTAPVYHRGIVYGAFLDGNLAAGDAKTGKRLWVRKLGAHLESSPLAVGDRLYLGTDSTDLLALRASDGKVEWRFNAPGAIKASPSHHDGRVYFADYQSSMFALDAESGKPVWRTNTSKVPPFGRGGFFSSPAIAFGKVYAARDDGTVYAFDEKTGRVEWSFDSGDYVYGSPAVAQVPRDQADRLHRRRKRPLLRARRRHRQGRVAPRRRRPDPRHRRRRRPHRLHLQLRDAENDRLRRPHPQEGVRDRAGRLHPGRLRWQAPLRGRLLRAGRARPEERLSRPS